MYHQSKPFIPLVCVNIYSIINYKVENKEITCDIIQIQKEGNSINNRTPLLKGSKKKENLLKSQRIAQLGHDLRFGKDMTKLTGEAEKEAC